MLNSNTKLKGLINQLWDKFCNRCGECSETAEYLFYAAEKNSVDVFCLSTQSDLIQFLKSDRLQSYIHPVS